MALETITGNLRDAYKQLQPGTMLHVDQLTNERRLNPITETGEDLCKQSFYTADGNLYTVNRRGRVIWGITREPQNLLLQNIAEAFHQLTQKGNYFLSLLEAEARLKHDDTILVEVEGLDLVGDGNKEFGYFVVDPKKVKKLNPKRKLVVTRIFGPDEDSFEQNMEMFAQAGKVPLVFALRPDYVKNTLKNNDTEYLARASWLYDFVNDSSFDANDRIVYGNNRVRGVRRIGAAAGDAQNQGPYRTPVQNEFKAHYDALFADPESAVKALDDKKAADLAGILQTYLATRGQ